MNKFVYKIGIENLSVLNGLVISETLPIEDNNGNKLVINKLTLKDSKVFFETVYLKVIKIINNKLYLELPESHIELFNWLDDKSTELLEKLMDLDNTNVSEIIECFNQSNENMEDIEYKPLLGENTNVLKINIFSDTTIKLSGKTVSVDEIKSGDMVGLVLGLDYISLLIENNSDKYNPIARTKLYCYYVEIHRSYKYIPEPREKINQWEFSSKLGSENIFVKTVTTENDNFDVKTETQDFIINNPNESVYKGLTNPSNKLSPVNETNDLDSISDIQKLNSDNCNKILEYDETSTEICFDSDNDLNIDKISEKFEPELKQESELKQEPEHNENIKLLSSVLENEFEQDNKVPEQNIVKTNLTNPINKPKKNVKTTRKKQTESKTESKTEYKTESKTTTKSKKTTNSKKKIETVDDKVSEKDDIKDKVNLLKNSNEHIEVIADKEKDIEQSGKQKKGRKKTC